MKYAKRADGNQPQIIDAMRSMWVCAECGVEKPATAHQKRQKYCSRPCMAAAYEKRMSAAQNPNYRDAAKKKCMRCGGDFNSYNKDRKYCSQRCYRGGADPKPAVVKQKRVARKKVCKHCQVEIPDSGGRVYCDAHREEAKAAQCAEIRKGRVASGVKVAKACAHCGVNFEHFPSADRKYCSYQCHLDSGGAFRAGKAAGSMTRKYGAKKDANHVEIVGAFRKLGAYVLDLSTLGSGVPDLVVCCKSRWALVDVKNPNTGYGRRGLNKNQKEWAEAWKGGPVYLVSSLDDVVAMVAGHFDKVKRFPEDRAHEMPTDSIEPQIHVVETPEQAIEILMRGHHGQQ